MPTDDRSQQSKPRMRTRLSRTEERRLRLRDASERFRRLLDKLEREQGSFRVPSEEPDVRRGIDDAQAGRRDLGDYVGRESRNPEQYPAHTAVGEDSSSEVEWISSRSLQSKRQTRAKYRRFTH